MVLWVPVAAGLGWVGVERHMVQYATQIAIVPVWFLAAYLLVCAAVPWTYRLHCRIGAWAVVLFVGAALVVDILHLRGVPLVGWSNFVWIWGGVHQVGYLWHDADRSNDGCNGLECGPSLS